MDTRNKAPILGYDELDVERNILGAIVVDNPAISSVIKILNVNAFTDSKYRRIYKAMLSLYTKRQPISVVSLNEELGKKIIDGPEVAPLDLVKLTDHTASSNHLVYDAKLVMERFLGRILHSDAKTIIAKIENREDDIFSIIGDADSRIASIIRRKKRLFGYSSLEQIAEETAESINTSADVVYTGFDFIDKKFGGLTRQALCSVLARPGHFKSTFTDFLMSSAAKKGNKVLIISLEDPVKQRVKRIVANELHLSLSAMRFKTTHVTSSEIMKVLHETLGSRLTLVDGKDVTTPEDASAVISDVQPDIVAVDHIQKFRLDDMVQGLISAVNILENAAIRNDCAVMVMSQVKDKTGPGGGVGAPEASDAYFTSAVHQSSAEMMSLFYPFALKRDQFIQDILELTILKSRYAGAIGKHFMRINPDQARIEGEIKD